MSASWHVARRILAIRLDAMGDVLMTTPALRALKEMRQRPELTLLTSPAGAEVARLVPEVDEAIAWQAPWMKATPAPDASADRALVGRLADGRFDAAVVFTVYSQSPWPAALLAHLAGIPLRLAHAREKPYHLLSDWVPESEPGNGPRHEVRRQLDLVAAVGARARDERLSLRVPPAATARVRAALRARGIDPARRFVLLHPGASAPSRRYRRFRAVAERLAARGWPLAVATDARDPAPPLEPPRAALVELASVGELAALVSLAAVLVANNSGPAHVAAAVGTPVVVLYALTNPQHTPWRVSSDVLFHPVACAFCYRSECVSGHHGCLTGVSPEAVVAAVERQLESPPAVFGDTPCVALA